jgi:hypothetical protein
LLEPSLDAATSQSRPLADYFTREALESPTSTCCSDWSSLTLKSLKSSTARHAWSPAMYRDYCTSSTSQTCADARPATVSTIYEEGRKIAEAQSASIILSAGRRERVKLADASA